MLVSATPLAWKPFTVQKSAAVTKRVCIAYNRHDMHLKEENEY